VAPSGRSSVGWFARGVAGIASVPAFVLMAAFIGFGGLARESGLTIGEAMLITGGVWALPNQVILVGAISGGVSIATAALAVTLSAVRLMPMVVSLVPVLRGRDTKLVTLLFLSHFVAVTAWIIAMMRLPHLPRHARIPYFIGFATALTSANILVTAVSFATISAVPDMIAGALFFLTPVYFLVSIWGAARLFSDRVAMVFGLILGPVMTLLAPEFDLLWTGLIGGTLAYLAGRIMKDRVDVD
jgi:predicted branched-subunit amino acid permease